MSQIVLYCLHSTSVPSFHIVVALTFSICQLFGNNWLIFLVPYDIVKIRGNNLRQSQKWCIETMLILLCSEQNFKTSQQLSNNFWDNEILGELALRCVWPKILAQGPSIPFGTPTGRDAVGLTIYLRIIRPGINLFEQDSGIGQTLSQTDISEQLIYGHLLIHIYVYIISILPSKWNLWISCQILTTWNDCSVKYRADTMILYTTHWHIWIYNTPHILWSIYVMMSWVCCFQNHFV